MKRLLAAVLALLLLAACAAPVLDVPEDEVTTTQVVEHPRPFTSEEIAEITQGLFTVGDFVEAFPAYGYWLRHDEHGFNIWFDFLPSDHPSRLYSSYLGAQPWLQLRILDHFRYSYYLLQHTETMPSWLLDKTVEIVRADIFTQMEEYHDEN
ncbi:MAG: hypothetical protein FWD06_07545 [Oscillospiraceae bacterium]|nr:hypothetical protein [Oscillospiraceae bacterium]